jgi:hypothetical protein
MLLLYDAQGRREMVPSYEWQWMGDDLADFAQRAPREHLLRQLFMFSPTFDIEEARDRISGLSLAFRLESFGDGLAELGKMVGVELESYRIDDPRSDNQIGRDVEARIATERLTADPILRQKLEPEYRLLEAVGL